MPDQTVGEPLEGGGMRGDGIFRTLGPIVLVGLITIACARSSTPVLTSPSASPAAASAKAARGCTDLRSGHEALIVMRNFRFVPSCVIMRRSQGAANRNEGTVKHNFSISGYTGYIDVDTRPGGTNRYEPMALKPGTYTFFCKYHRARGMQGQLRIVAG